jgi:chemotaxis protein MotA
MLPIIGVVIVFAAVIVGFLMEKGHLLVLVQPSELVTIVGAAIGTLIVANPIHIIKAMIAGIGGALSPSKFGKTRYLDTLRMLFELCNKVRKKGLIGIEDDVEKPVESEIFKKYPAFLKDHHAQAFVCDTLRTAITGGVEPFDMDQMMESDMEVAHHEALEPVNALSTVADALPGLGIVAAVLGVVITMGSLGGPPEEIGKKVAAALVGTFLGILLCYGVVGPTAANMTKEVDAQDSYLHVMRIVILAFLKGLAPILAVEMGRRAIPEHVRPSFDEMENACKRPAEAAQTPAGTEDPPASAEPAQG